MKRFSLLCRSYALASSHLLLFCFNLFALLHTLQLHLLPFAQAFQFFSFLVRPCTPSHYVLCPWSPVWVLALACPRSVTFRASCTTSDTVITKAPLLGFFRFDGCTLSSTMRLRWSFWSSCIAIFTSFRSTAAFVAAVAATLLDLSAQWDLTEDRSLWLAKRHIPCYSRAWDICGIIQSIAHWRLVVIADEHRPTVPSPPLPMLTCCSSYCPCFSSASCQATVTASC